MQSKPKTLLEKLLYTEIPQDFEHPLVKPLGALWGVLAAALVVGIVFMFGSLESLTTLYNYFDSKEQKVFLYLFISAAVLGLLYRSYYAIRGIFMYEKTVGEPLRDGYIIFVISSIFVQYWLIITIFSFAWLYLFLNGSSLEEAALASFDLRLISHHIDTWINTLPTLIELPYWAAILFSIIIMSFFGYFWHRMAHESRLLWLLSHRPHHVSTALSHATVFEADPKFPFGFIWQYLCFGVLAGVTSKLFSHDHYLIELLLIKMAVGTFEIHNHISADYEWITKNKPLMRFFHALGGQGPYHYLHHSSDPKHAVINIGGGYFMFWDWVFGTYERPPEKKPKIGLTNQPEIYHNPFNLALSGLLQIIYELRHNSIKYWLPILFGSVYYIPPNTKRYLFKNK